MRIRFYLRTPGKHVEIATVEFDGVPRIGESVVIGKDGETMRENLDYGNYAKRSDYYIVHDVTWDFAEKDVAVLVK